MRITTLADIVRVHGRARAERPAITFEGRTRTYGELDRRSSQVAQALRAAGVAKEDRVAFYDKNAPEYFELIFGAAKLGAVTVAVNWRLAPREVGEILGDAEARVLVVGQALFGELEQVEHELPGDLVIVAIGDHPRWQEWGDWVGAHTEDDPGVVSEPGDVAFQLYTSGTTGVPKGVMLTNANVFALSPVAADVWGFSADMVSLGVMPLFHVSGSGWNITVMAHGGHCVIHREVEPPQILRAIPEHGVTHTVLVPAVIAALLDQPEVGRTDVSTLRLVLYGASPISDDVLVRALRTFGCDFAQGYGLTETMGAVTLLAPGDHDPSRPELLRSCGRAMPGAELRVVDADTGEEAPDGVVGEVWVRSPQNMLGYWRKPEETAATKTADGWVKTGDAGYLEDGYLYLYDRVKDMIVSGGENVYPAEVENVLMGHPAVADVAVIGVPDPRWGETVKAVVVPADGATIDPAALIAHARAHLAHYKCPTSVDAADVLPRNASGKLLKKELREPYWVGQERRIGG